VALLLAACAAEPDQARRAARAVGLRNIQLGLYPWFMCGQDDLFNTAFTATNARGERVKGAVCCGLGKGCTVRFE
jgi:hypothetical protein